MTLGKSPAPVRYQVDDDRSVPVDACGMTGQALTLSFAIASRCGGPKAQGAEG